MTDRELLELAAKAAGYTLKWGEEYIVGGDKIDCTDMPYVVSGQPDEADWYWDPLTDDGDALRLAVKLGIHIRIRRDRNSLETIAPTVGRVNTGFGDDPYAATRRAIVRAAAEIGKEMK